MSQSLLVDDSRWRYMIGSQKLEVFHTIWVPDYVEMWEKDQTRDSAALRRLSTTLGGEDRRGGRS